jgi:hypothetical protein
VAKLVQSVKDPQFEALQDHVVGTLNLPIRPGVCHGCLIHTNMVIIIETEKILPVNCVSLLVMIEFGTPKR